MKKQEIKTEKRMNKGYKTKETDIKKQIFKEE